VRLDIRRITSIKERGELIGNRTRVRVTKNKVAPPFRVAEFDLMYDEGISREGDLLDVAVELGVMDKRGSYYYYGDEDQYLAQGRENAKEFLREHADVAAQIEAAVRESLDIEMAPSGEPDAEKAVEGHTTGPDEASVAAWGDDETDLAE
jgi:recombination protein RecA